MNRILHCSIALGLLLVTASCGERPEASASSGAPLLGISLRSIAPLARRKHVDFSLTDNSLPTHSESFIYPQFPITPYNQWEENNGYCGELSAIEAGMGSGQWMSQFNSRLICGAGLSQSGPDGFCAAHDDTANYNSQFLFENMMPGDQPFASAATCLANAHLVYQMFDYAHQANGLDGYHQFMSWVKARVIAGNVVAVGVLNRGGTDPQYDHEVTVSKIGTNHSPSDATYYDDDVLYFEDHGPASTSYNQGYSFASLANTRTGANAADANVYSILIPGGPTIETGTGGDGININPIPIVPANYGFAVAGPADTKHELLPLAMAIVGSSVNGVPNSPQPSLGFNFESPEIGGEIGLSCTNVPPTWMGISLQVTASGLTPGVSYRLYEYDFPNITGFGTQAALKVPDSDFNANGAEASSQTSFVAQTSSFSQTIQTTSDHVIVFRCVRADAP